MGALNEQREAGDLRKVCRASEVQYPHVIVHGVAIESAKDEQSSIAQEGDMVPSCWWWSARCWFVLELECHCGCERGIWQVIKKHGGQGYIPRLNKSSSLEYLSPSWPPIMNR